jgi:hypothetical protein
MSIRLPEPIDSYFRYTASGDLKEAAATFAPEATIVDEGEDATVVGREPIHQWMLETAAKHATTLEVVGTDERDGEVVLAALVSGGFPGSPAEFRYRFVLGDGLIDRLVIEFVGFK